VNTSAPRNECLRRKPTSYRISGPSKSQEPVTVPPLDAEMAAHCCQFHLLPIRLRRRANERNRRLVISDLHRTNRLLCRGARGQLPPTGDSLTGCTNGGQRNHLVFDKAKLRFI
jgi:hypothetical protein